MTRAHADEDVAPNHWLEPDETDKSQAEPQEAPGDDPEWPKPIRRDDPDPKDKAQGEGQGLGFGWKVAIYTITGLVFVGIFGEPIGKLAVQALYGGDGAQPQ